MTAIRFSSACILLVFVSSVDSSVSGQERFTSQTHDRPISIDTSTSSNGNYVNYGRVIPLVIRPGIDSFSLEIGVTDSSFVSVAVLSDSLHYYTGVQMDKLLLYDDGTNTDRVAGDRIFTVGGLTSDRSHWPNFRVEFTTADGAQMVENPWLPLHIKTIDPDVVAIPSVRQLAEDVYVTSHVINVVSPDTAGTYPYQQLGNRDYDFFGDWSVKRYYDFFPDDRDFFVELIPLFHDATLATAGSIEKFVEGIGGYPVGRLWWAVLPRYDYTTRLGSSIHLTPQYMSHEGLWGMDVFRLWNHEMLHRWGVGVGSIGMGFSHWNRPNTFGSSGFGYDGFWGAYISLEQGTDSTSVFCRDADASGNELNKLNDFELYLAGLIGPEEVRSTVKMLGTDSYSYPVNAERTDFTVDDKECKFYWGTDIKEHSVYDIIAAFGPRIPSHETSPKNMNGFFLFDYDRPLTPVEFAFFDYMVREWEKPESDFGLTWEAATGGRMSLSMQLPASLVAIETDEEPPENHRLETYPNPVTTTTTIRFNTHTGVHTRLLLFDTLGRQLLVLVDEWKSAGRYEMTFDASGLSSGVYLLSLTAGSSVQVRAFVVTR